MSTPNREPNPLPNLLIFNNMPYAKFSNADLAAGFFVRFNRQTATASYFRLDVRVVEFPMHVEKFWWVAVIQIKEYSRASKTQSAQNMGSTEYLGISVLRFTRNCRLESVAYRCHYKIGLISDHSAITVYMLDSHPPLARNSVQRNCYLLQLD